MGKGNQGKILEIAHSSDLNEARSLLMHLSIKKQSNLIIIINFFGIIKWNISLIYVIITQNLSNNFTDFLK